MISTEKATHLCGPSSSFPVCERFPNTPVYRSLRGCSAFACVPAPPHPAGWHHGPLMCLLPPPPPYRKLKGKHPVLLAVRPGPYRVSHGTKLKQASEQWLRRLALEANRIDFLSKLCRLLDVSLEEDTYLFFMQPYNLINNFIYSLSV